MGFTFGDEAGRVTSLKGNYLDAGRGYLRGVKEGLPV